MIVEKLKLTENILFKIVETSSKMCFILYVKKPPENCILMDSDGFRISFVKEVKPTEFDFPPAFHSVGFLFCRIPGLTVSESVRQYGTLIKSTILAILSRFISLRRRRNNQRRSPWSGDGGICEAYIFHAEKYTHRAQVWI